MDVGGIEDPMSGEEVTRWPLMDGLNPLRNE